MVYGNKHKVKPKYHSLFPAYSTRHMDYILNGRANTRVLLLYLC